MKIVLAGLAIFAVAACGGGGSTSTPTSASSTSVPTSASSVAQRTGCTGFATITPTLYALDEGDCTLGPDSLDVVTFADNGKRDQWVKVAKGFGGSYVVGDRFAVTGMSPGSVGQVASGTGGAAA